MKKNADSDGFTLAELLITIAIIALIAAILLPVVNKAILKGETARARADMASLVTAVKAYYAEYGMYPTAKNGDPDATYDDIGVDTQEKVLDILRAQQTLNNPGHVYNRKQIVFLDVPNDSLFNGRHIDPWGNTYAICMDTDYDNELFVDANNFSTTVVSTTVGVLSPGPVASDPSNYLLSWSQ